MTDTDWRIFTGTSQPHDQIDMLPAPPPWRPQRRGTVMRERWLPNDNDALVEANDRGSTYQCNKHVVELVNAALYLRRPLLVTGKAGTGKSSLIYAVAKELRLGPVLRWPVTSRSTLREGLYEYDAIARLQDAQLHSTARRSWLPWTRASVSPDLGKYLKLGPLGTALVPTRRPWALLIDEIDKADIDLPNALLNVFEEGEFEIPELRRSDTEWAQVAGYEGKTLFPIQRGRIRCYEFPFVVLTNNGEREFPPPFLRRCLRLDLPEPSEDLLARIVAAHLGSDAVRNASTLIANFLSRREQSELATDQLLNAIFMVTRGSSGASPTEKDALANLLLQALSLINVND